MWPRARPGETRFEAECGREGGRYNVAATSRYAHLQQNARPPGLERSRSAHVVAAAFAAARPLSAWSPGRARGQVVRRAFARQTDFAAPKGPNSRGVLRTPPPRFARGGYRVSGTKTVAGGRERSEATPGSGAPRCAASAALRRPERRTRRLRTADAVRLGSTRGSGGNALRAQPPAILSYR